MNRLIVLAAIVVVVVIFTVIARAFLYRRNAIQLIDPADLGAARGGPAGGAQRQVVVFTSPYCHGCREWLSALEAEGTTPVALDIAARPELAARYRINVTPRVAVVRSDNGEVLGEWDHYAPRAHDIERVTRLLNIC